MMAVALVASLFAVLVACTHDATTNETCNGMQGKSTSPCSTGPQYADDYENRFPQDELPATTCTDPDWAAALHPRIATRRERVLHVRTWPSERKLHCRRLGV